MEAPAADCADCTPQKAMKSEEVAKAEQQPTLTPEIKTSPGLTIEYCNRCRWQHRAAWVQTELLLTFPSSVIASSTLIPLEAEDTAGRFRIWLQCNPQDSPLLIWDRKQEGGFPELKVVKQKIRDILQPGKSLGHSDRK